MIMEGRILQDILKKKGITQTQVAELLGVTRQTVSAMMKTASVKSTTLEKIAESFGIDILEFFGGGDVVLMKKQLQEKDKKIAELEAKVKEKDESIMRLIGIIEKRI